MWKMTRSLLFDAEAHLSPFLGIFEGVGNQIGDDELKFEAIEVEQNLVMRGFEAVLDILLAEHVRIVVVQRPAKLHYILTFEAQPEVFCSHLPEVHYATYERVESFGVSQHVIHIDSGSLHGVGSPFENLLYLCHDEENGSAQFVHDARIEVGLRLVQSLFRLFLHLGYLHPVSYGQVVHPYPHGYPTDGHCQDQIAQLDPPAEIPGWGDDNQESACFRPVDTVACRLHLEGIMAGRYLGVLDCAHGHLTPMGVEAFQ